MELHKRGHLRKRQSGPDKDRYFLNCTCGLDSGAQICAIDAKDWWHAHYLWTRKREYSRNSDNPLEAIVALVSWR